MQSYHVRMLEVVALIVLIGVLVLISVPLIRRTPRGEPGTLLITGVSPRPDATGEQFVTVAGVINGPSVTEHEVYGRIAMDVANWPVVGQLIPVVYSPKNPDNWNFAPNPGQGPAVPPA